MKIHSSQPRSEYLDTQIQRSRRKFSYCKVSARDPLAYFNIISRYSRRHNLPKSVGPVLCLGVRNGREVDLFRTALVSPLVAKLVAVTEMKVRGFLSPLDFLAGSSRSKTDQINSRSVLGVEVNPDARRQDIWVGSFDEMPADWANKFGTVYSNSFDQSHNPQRSAAEWLRVTRPGGFLIIAFGINKEPSSHDPVGGLSMQDVRDLFPGELIYFNAMGTVYAELIVRKNP